MKRIILLRHGRTMANDRRLYCGSTDIPLSDIGRAELLSLREGRTYPALDGYRVYTSGMLRAEETLQVLYGRLPHGVLPGFREVDFGAFEMRSYEELCRDPAYLAWCGGDNESNVPPGGESGAQMRRRVIRCFEEIVAEGDLAVICHGGPIAAVMEYLFPEEGKNRYQWQPRNGEGYLICLGRAEKTWRNIPQGGEEHGGER